MAKYKVIGPQQVAGVDPGEPVDLEDGDGINLAALLAAGHIEPANKTAARQAAKAEAEAEPQDG